MLAMLKGKIQEDFQINPMGRVLQEGRAIKDTSSKTLSLIMNSQLSNNSSMICLMNLKRKKKDLK